MRPTPIAARPNTCVRHPGRAGPGGRGRGPGTAQLLPRHLGSVCGCAVGREAEEAQAPFEAGGARHEEGGVEPLDGNAGGGGAHNGGRRELAAAYCCFVRAGRTPGHHARCSAGANDVAVAGAAAPLQDGGCGRAPHVFNPLLVGCAAAEGLQRAEARGVLLCDLTSGESPPNQAACHLYTNAAMNIRWCALCGATLPAHLCHWQPALHLRPLPRLRIPR
jgi:hypothetical protein